MKNKTSFSVDDLVEHKEYGPGTVVQVTHETVCFELPNALLEVPCYEAEKDWRMLSDSEIRGHARQMKDSTKTNCPNCRRENRTDAKACSECGYPLFLAWGKSRYPKYAFELAFVKTWRTKLANIIATQEDNLAGLTDRIRRDEQSSAVKIPELFKEVKKLSNLIEILKRDKEKIDNIDCRKRRRRKSGRSHATGGQIYSVGNPRPISGGLPGLGKRR